MKRIINEAKINNIVKKVIKEYLDKEYMYPLWKSLHLKNKKKYLPNLKFDGYYNTFSFVAFLLGKDVSEQDFYENFKPIKNKYLLKLFNEYEDAYDLENNKEVQEKIGKLMYDYIVANYKNFWRILKEWSEQVYFSSSYKEPSDFKSNLFFSNPKIIHNKWICHFTKKGSFEEIKGRPKTYIDKLALTFGSDIGEINNGNGGYSFGYLAEELINEDTLSLNYDYGTNIIMFVGNGISISHATDRENQVIFNPAMVNKNNCVYLHVTKEEIYNEEASYNDSLHIKPYTLCSTYCEVLTNEGTTIYSSYDTTDCIKWVMLNYAQYRKKISQYRKYNVNDDDFNYISNDNLKTCVNGNEDLLKQFDDMFNKNTKGRYGKYLTNKKRNNQQISNME